MSISVPPKGDEAKRVGAYFTPLKVDAQAVPDMTVRIQAGSFYTALGEHKEFSGGNTPTISAPTAAGAKWVVVAINENALIEIYNGATSSSPELPVLPENVLPLAGIFVGDTATMITSDMVFDIRPLWQVRPENIPNLAGELADRPTITDVNALLALKADIGGTPETSFVLNQDQVGVPGADVELIVERGANPNTGIRWNETLEQWEFTNDGVTYDPIGASSGVYYTQAQLDGGQLDTRYYTKTQLDGGVLDTIYYQTTDVDALVAGKADAVHTHVYTDITDFAAGVAATAGSVFAPVVHTHVAADITDFVAEAQTAGAAVFATIAHNHVVADITDFTAGVATEISSASIDDLADVNIGGPVAGQSFVWNGIAWTNANLVIDNALDVDTTTVPPVAAGEALLWDGISMFSNRAIVKADVSDFVEADYVHVSGNETIGGDKTFTGNTTLNGTLVDITATNLDVADDVILINAGEAGAGVGGGTGNAGLRVDRGSLTDAVFQWDEGTSQWLVGIDGSAQPLVDAAHSHTVGNITDFAAGVTTQLGNNDLNTMQDVTYPVAPVLNDILLRDGAGQWNATGLSAVVTTELGLNTIDALSDVDTTTSAPVAQDALFWDGANWVNRAAVKADVSDFVEADYVHTTGTETIGGDKTFSNNVIVTGDLSVNGTLTTVNTTDLEITDNTIILNNGETGAGVTSGNAGIEIDRGTSTNAALLWDEVNGDFRAGLLGTLIPISLLGHTHILTDITDVTASAAEVNQLVGITLGPGNEVQTQLNDKISRAGDTMNGGVNLTFAAGGEVDGLPATPAGPTSAVSDAWLTTQLATQDELAEMNDVTITAVASGEALMHDGVDWKNRLLVEADISDLGTTILVNGDIGVTVQAWDADLDTIAGLAHSGDEMIYSNAGTWDTFATTAFGRGLVGETDATSTRTTLDLYSATQLDAGQLDNRYYTETELDAGQLDNRYYTETELDGAAGSAGAKIDKVSGATLDNVTTMLASGEVQDSGTALSALALTANHYTKAENDGAAGSAGAKIDKVSGATAGNIAEFGGAGDLVDSGVATTDVLTTTTTGAIAHVIGDLADVTDASATGDLLQKTGGGWQNIAPNSILEFVHTQGSIAESITGDKTFADDVVVSGNLTVNGTTTTVNSVNLDVTDQVIRVNDGYVGVAIGNSGLEANRDGTASVANLLWDEGGSIGANTIAQRWVGGLNGAEQAFAQETVTVAQPDYEVQVAGAVQSVFTTALTVPVPTGAKAAEQVFVNGIKQIPGAAKHYQVTGYAPLAIAFNAGEEPPTGADVEFYAFGTIG